jgi:hypothetical protein
MASRYMGGGATREEDEAAAGDELKYEMDFKGKLMEEEYARITKNIDQVESFCDKLDVKVVHFRTVLGETTQALEDVEIEDKKLTIDQLKQKIEEGRAQITKYASLKTIHSDPGWCDICQSGHKRTEECTGYGTTNKFGANITNATMNRTANASDTSLDNNKIGSQGSGGSPEPDKSQERLKIKNPNKPKKPKPTNQATSNQQYEAKRLANMDPEMLKDMMERRRMLEIKKKEREWAKMSAKEKKDFIEKENKRKYEKTFREKAEKMRVKVREQLQELKDEDSSSEDQLAQFDQQKAQRREAMDNQREERELINDAENGEEGAFVDPRRAKKIEAIKKKHEAMVQDLSNPEKVEEMRKNAEMVRTAMMELKTDPSPDPTSPTKKPRKPKKSIGAQQVQEMSGMIIDQGIETGKVRRDGSKAVIELSRDQKETIKLNLNAI